MDFDSLISFLYKYIFDYYYVLFVDSIYASGVSNMLVNTYVWP